MLQRIAVVLAHAKANKTVRLSISCAFCTSNTLVIMIKKVYIYIYICRREMQVYIYIYIYIYRREMQQVYIDR